MINNVAIWYFRLLKESEELRMFDKVRIYLDEDYSSAENFTVSTTENVTLLFLLTISYNMGRQYFFVHYSLPVKLLGVILILIIIINLY